MLEPQDPTALPVADSVLMDRLARRDSTALVELERRHRASLYAQAYSVLMDAGSAERVVRDAFSQLWFAAATASRASETAWSLLRDMARELARAERALKESPVSRR